MKKYLLILFILVLSISMVSCGDEKDNTETQQSSTRTSENRITTQQSTTEESDREESGYELSDFFDDFNSATGKFEGAINDFTTDDMEFFDIGLDYLVPQMHIAFIGTYDILEITGSDEGEYREQDGNIIKFGKNFIRSEDGFSPNDKKGDKVVAEGSFDIKTKTLFYESHVERKGVKVDREITEAIMLDDGSFVVQTLLKSFSQVERGIEDKGNAYFILCEENKLQTLKATFPPDIDFKYESIAGKGKIAPEEMAGSYEKVRKLIVENGKASAEKY